MYRQDGSGLGGLTTVACASPFYNGQSSTTFTVQARSGANRTTSFVFNYTFTAEDKTLGKVTFQAVATSRRDSNG